MTAAVTTVLRQALPALAPHLRPLLRDAITAGGGAASAAGVAIVDGAVAALASACWRLANDNAIEPLPSAFADLLALLHSGSASGSGEPLVDGAAIKAWAAPQATASQAAGALVTGDHREAALAACAAFVAGL